MARRREVEDDDGLELFLSTSCDSFGGIVFIMLLICLLPTKKMDVMLDDLNQSKAKLAKMHAEIDALERKGAPALDLQKQFELHHQTEVQKEARRVAELTAQLAQKEKELEQRQRERDELEKTVSAPPNPNGEVRYTRRPYLHEVDKQSFPIVLFQNKIYLPQTGPMFSFNVDDFKVTKFPTFLQFAPIAGKGQDIQTWLKAASGLRAVSEALPREKAAINVMLYPDSIKSFDAVRSAFAALGYDYNWTPLETTETVNLDTGGGGPGKKTDAQ